MLARVADLLMEAMSRVRSGRKRSINVENGRLRALRTTPSVRVAVCKEHRVGIESARVKLGLNFQDGRFRQLGTVVKLKMDAQSQPAERS